MADVDSKITLKLLIDARSHKVILGEAGKKFVDFMFSLLTLPLGFVIKLLSPQTMVGSIEKLYQSVENLNEIYLVANRDNSTLLLPKESTFDVATSLLMGNERNDKFRPAPAHGFGSPFGARNEEENVGGFVKDVITYMITDELEVTPMSAISCITLINRFNMKDAQLEEKVVLVGMKEGLALLKASLESSTVLTDVFCSSAKGDRASI